MLAENVETKPIITSLLWTDLYKLTMGQAVFHNYPDLEVQYEFINRGKHQFPDGFGKKLEAQIEMMSDLSLSTSDRDFLQEKCPYLQTDYLDFMQGYRFDPKEVQVKQIGSELSINIEGQWKNAIHWEVTLMALICELYYKETGKEPDSQYIERAKRKGETFQQANLLFSEFGARRAFSQEVHYNSLGALIETAGLVKDGGVLLGTSNVALAKEYNIDPNGTCAHEWTMAHAALFGYVMANEKALEVWAKEYLGLDGGPVFPKLGVALTDTYTTDVFLRTFNEKWAKLYTFLRQDSGNPFEQGEKILVGWQRALGGSPLDFGKGTIFSDGLDTEKALALNQLFKPRELAAFGIGTHLTNDAGWDPMNIVIKAFAFRNRGGLWIPSCKLSDDFGKSSGEPVEQARRELHI